MILAIDIGNTNIVLGCVDDNKTYFIERLSTIKTKMELEYAIDIKMVPGGVAHAVALRGLLDLCRVGEMLAEALAEGIINNGKLRFSIILS